LTELPSPLSLYVLPFEVGVEVLLAVFEEEEAILVLLEVEFSRSIFKIPKVKYIHQNIVCVILKTYFLGKIVFSVWPHCKTVVEAAIFLHFAKFVYLLV
jgi:hypothetical protein